MRLRRAFVARHSAPRRLGQDFEKFFPPASVAFLPAIEWESQTRAQRGSCRRFAIAVFRDALIAMPRRSARCLRCWLAVLVFCIARFAERAAGSLGEAGPTPRRPPTQSRDAGCGGSHGQESCASVERVCRTKLDALRRPTRSLCSMSAPAADGRKSGALHEATSAAPLATRKTDRKPRVCDN